MELIVTNQKEEINVEAIHKGDFIRAKYEGWNEERNGLVAGVSPEEIRVIWQPGIRNVTNYFVISATEAAAGLWTVKWSTDMEIINTKAAAAHSDGGVTG